MQLAIDTHDREHLVPTRITPAQCRAARALLGWDQVTLGERSGLPKTTVARFESSATNPHPGTMEALMSAFSKAGITFVASDGVSGVLRITVDKPHR